MTTFKDLKKQHCIWQNIRFPPLKFVSQHYLSQPEYSKIYQNWSKPSKPLLIFQPEKNICSLHNYKSEITNSLKSKLEWDKQITLKKNIKKYERTQIWRKKYPPKNILLNWISNENFHTCIYFSNLSYRTTKIHFLVLKNMSVINSNFWK